jgi:uncharacterized membrane protein YedE/YeeE
MTGGILMIACGAVISVLAGAELLTGRHRRWLAIGFSGDANSTGSVRWYGAGVGCAGAYALVAGTWLALGTPAWNLWSRPLVGYLAFLAMAAAVGCQALSARAARTRRRRRLAPPTVYR